MSTGSNPTRGKKKEFLFVRMEDDSTRIHSNKLKILLEGPLDSRTLVRHTVSHPKNERKTEVSSCEERLPHRLQLSRGQVPLLH